MTLREHSLVEVLEPLRDLSLSLIYCDAGNACNSTHEAVSVSEAREKAKE